MNGLISVNAYYVRQMLDDSHFEFPGVLTEKYENCEEME